MGIIDDTSAEIERLRKEDLEAKKAIMIDPPLRWEVLPDPAAPLHRRISAAPHYVVEDYRKKYVDLQSVVVATLSSLPEDIKQQVVEAFSKQLEKQKENT